MIASVAVQGPTRTAARAPPSRWPQVPAPDREVEHLGAEDEQRDQAGERGGAVVELAPGAAQGEGDPTGGDDGGGDGGRRVEEPVGHVHGALLASGATGDARPRGRPDVVLRWRLPGWDRLGTAGDRHVIANGSQ